MTRYWPLLILLAAIWGASYLFIKVAVEDVEPAPMMAIRALGAALLLAAYLVATLGARRAVSEVTTNWRPALVLGVFNAAVPFWLVAWGEKYVDSSVAGIAQSTVPIFTFLLAGFDPRGGWLAVAGTLAVVLSSLSYASSGIFGQLRVRTVAGPVLATGSMLVGGLVLLPIALLQLPSELPDAEAIASILALTVLGTALAQLILFRMLRLYGSRRLSLVTYLMPGFAVVYGAVLLDEPVSAGALVGLALILGGVALASGQRLLRTRASGREELAQKEAA
jgi:drug/metabolite transporter (DMT)-like permease